MIRAPVFKKLNRYAPATRAGRLGAAAACLVVVLATAAIPMARAAGRALVVGSRLPGRADYVAPLAGDRALDRAAELILTGKAGAALLIESPPNRLDELFPEAHRSDVRRGRLRELGVEDSRIRSIARADGAPVEDGWDAARLLDELLAREPDATVVALADEFGSRCQDMIFRRVVPADRRARIFLLPLPHRHYGPRNWWRGREGIKAIFNASLEVVFTWIYGETPSRPAPWDPEEWERALREKAKRDPRLARPRPALGGPTSSATTPAPNPAPSSSNRDAAAEF